MGGGAIDIPLANAKTNAKTNAAIGEGFPLIFSKPSKAIVPLPTDCFRAHASNIPTKPKSGTSKKSFTTSNAMEPEAHFVDEIS